MYRILHVIDSQSIYGAEKVIEALMLEQVKAGYEPLLLNISTNDIADNVFNEWSAKTRLSYDRIRLSSPFSGKMIIQYAENNYFEVVHSHSYKSNILLSLTNRKEIPVITTIHGWTASRWFSKLMFYSLVDAFLSNFLDRVIFVSASISTKIQSKLILKRNCLVIHNGITLSGELMVDHHQSLDYSEISENKFIIGFIGRLSLEKGPKVLLDAFTLLSERYPHIELLYIGDGNERPCLEELCSKNNLNHRVSFKGFCSEPLSILKQISVLVMPSLTEGLPIVLLEALSQKTPVIASAVGGIPELIQSDVNGMLFPSGDVDKLVECLEWAINNCDELLSLGQAGYLKVEHEYNSLKMHNKYAAVYNEVILNKC